MEEEEYAALVEAMGEMLEGPFVAVGEGMIDCVFRHPTRGPLPFTASATDVEVYGRAAYDAAVPRIGT